jgi:hypothetical protein
MASGDTLLIFHPYNAEAPASNYATLDTRNNVPTLDFDDTTDESGVFNSIMPQSYAATTGVDVKIKFMMETATSGNVVLTTAFEAEGTDMDSDSFASAQTATVAVSGTSGIEVTGTIQHTAGAQMDSVVAGSRFRLQVTRDADNASDTATGDLELTGVEIRET